MKANSVKFTIRRCKDKPNCKPTAEIDKFIEDIMIQLYIVDSSIDLRYFNKDGVFRN